MIKRYKNFSGVVLAGGHARRMTQAKEFLRIKNKRIIDITLETLNFLFEEILIVTNNKSRFNQLNNSIAIEDLIKGCGPLGGIYTGLKAITNPKAFFVACDMPFLHSGLIKRLLNEASKTKYSAIVPRTNKGIEPLHAVYSKDILDAIEASLAKENYR